MKHWTPGKGARANSATQASLRLVQVPFSLPCIRVSPLQPSQAEMPDFLAAGKGPPCPSTDQSPV